MLLTSVLLLWCLLADSLHLPLSSQLTSPIVPGCLLACSLPCPACSSTTVAASSSAVVQPLRTSADRVLHRQCLYFCSAKRVFCQLVCTLTIASRSPSRYSRLPPDHDHPTEPHGRLCFHNNFAAVTSIE